MKDLSKEIEALRDRINSVSIEFNQIVSQIQEAESKKANAKVDYQKALDAGFEDEMSACLATVRQSNQEIASLRSQLGSYPGKVSDLYSEQKELVTLARGERPKAEEALKKAQENIRSVEVQINNAGANLLSELNQLNDAVKDKARMLVFE